MLEKENPHLRSGCTVYGGGIQSLVSLCAVEHAILVNKNLVKVLKSDKIQQEMMICDIKCKKVSNEKIHKFPKITI